MQVISGFQKRVGKLVNISRHVQSFAYTQFDWPENIPEDCWWFSPESLSIFGTPLYDELSEDQLKTLSKWECTNLFSLNVTGEQSLISDVIGIIQQPMLADAREYLHHFIEEESQHMWYFNEFCKRYSGKTYEKKTVSLGASSFPNDIDLLLIFSRITIFEEAGHYYNVANASDKRLHPFIVQLNAAHKTDEGRHISFGRSIIAQLAGDIVKKYPEDTLKKIEDQLLISLNIVVESFYNPNMYRDANLGRGITIRQSLLNNPVRKRFNKTKLIGNIYKLFVDTGLIERKTAINA